MGQSRVLRSWLTFSYRVVDQYAALQALHVNHTSLEQALAFVKMYSSHKEVIFGKSKVRRVQFEDLGVGHTPSPEVEESPLIRRMRQFSRNKSVSPIRFAANSDRPSSISDGNSLADRVTRLETGQDRQQQLLSGQQQLLTGLRSMSDEQQGTLKEQQGTLKEILTLLCRSVSSSSSSQERIGTKSPDQASFSL